MKNLIQSILLTLLFAFSFSAFSAPVNINTADAKTLEKNIKGVGSKKANDIVLYRKKHGPYQSPQDITKVKGIGPKILEKNKGIILVKKP